MLTGAALQHAPRALRRNRPGGRVVQPNRGVRRRRTELNKFQRIATNLSKTAAARPPTRTRAAPHKNAGNLQQRANLRRFCAGRHNAQQRADTRRYKTPQYDRHPSTTPEWPLKAV